MKRASLAASIQVILFSAIALQGALAQTKPDNTVSRDELRACMNSENELLARRKTMEDRAARQREEASALQAEAKELAQEQKQLAEERKSMDRFQRKVKEHNVRIQEAKNHADSVAKDLAAFNHALAAYNEKCGSISFKQEDKDAILKEREAAGK